MTDAGPTLEIIGCGTMGEAIAAGLLKSEPTLFSRSRLLVTTRREANAKRLATSLAVTAMTDNQAACARADIVLLALKPQRLPTLLDNTPLASALADKLVISIAAGVTLSQLTRWLPRSALVRAMPNTPVLIGAGMTVLARGEGVPDEQVEQARRIFAAVGDCIELEDKLMNAVTSLNGSGPAFAYVMLEAMADGGVMMGLPRDIALKIAARVCEGAARMVLDTHHHPAALKDQVTTPAGCTIAGLLTMEDGRIRSVLARTIQEAARVAEDLGKR
jgi:pyrroline-5-carboxylate reductase